MLGGRAGGVEVATDRGGGWWQRRAGAELRHLSRAVRILIEVERRRLRLVVRVLQPLLCALRCATPAKPAHAVRSPALAPAPAHHRMLPNVNAGAPPVANMHGKRGTDDRHVAAQG